jgi:hypothetical protein
MNLESREAANASGDIGHFFGALQIDGLIDKPNSKKIDEWFRVFRKTPLPTPAAR